MVVDGNQIQNYKIISHKSILILSNSLTVLQTKKKYYNKQYVIDIKFIKSTVRNDLFKFNVAGLKHYTVIKLMGSNSSLV